MPWHEHILVKIAQIGLSQTAGIIVLFVANVLVDGVERNIISSPVVIHNIEVVPNLSSAKPERVEPTSICFHTAQKQERALILPRCQLHRICECEVELQLALKIPPQLLSAQSSPDRPRTSLLTKPGHIITQRSAERFRQGETAMIVGVFRFAAASDSVIMTAQFI